MSYALPIVLLIVGALLIIVFTPLAWRKETVTNQVTGQTYPQDMETTFLLEQLQTLEKEMSHLKAELSLNTRNKTGNANHAEQEDNSNPIADQSFQTTLLEEQQAGQLPDIELYRAVFQAFDAGKDLTEIAQELGRGKGEIQLILNLRR